MRLDLKQAVRVEFVLPVSRRNMIDKFCEFGTARAFDDELPAIAITDTLIERGSWSE